MSFLGCCMLLIGVNRSPYTRRVAITLRAYGVPYEQQGLSGFGNRAEVRAQNPLRRTPALVLDNGEVMVDNPALIHLPVEPYRPPPPPTPPHPPPHPPAPT